LHELSETKVHEKNLMQHAEIYQAHRQEWDSVQQNPMIVTVEMRPPWNLAVEHFLSLCQV
jgi:hypothetical protein